MSSETAKIIRYSAWLIGVAFLFGAATNIGRKTIDHIWPDKPQEVNVKYQPEIK